MVNYPIMAATVVLVIYLKPLKTTWMPLVKSMIYAMVRTTLMVAIMFGTYILHGITGKYIMEIFGKRNYSDGRNRSSLCELPKIRISRL